MSQFECLEILKKVRKEKCEFCNGKGCDKCFETGSKLITTVEISQMIGIAINNVSRNLKKLEKEELATHFEQKYPRQYKWMVVE